MQLGIAAGPVPLDSRALTPEVARRLAGLGLSVVVTHFDPRPERMPPAEARRVRDVLADAGIRIVQAAGYRANLVTPDEDERERGLAGLREVLPVVRDMGAEMFITGCGSLDAANFYGPHPGNHRPETRERLVDGLRRIAPWAEENDVVVALECHLLTTLDSPRTIREVLDAVDSTHVRANFDPVNLLGDLPSVYGSAAAMETMLDVVGPRYARCAHAKDVVVGTGAPLQLFEAAPGEGHLDFAAFFAACRRLGEGTAVVVEHLPVDRAVPAIAFVQRAAEAAGVTFVAPVPA